MVARLVPDLVGKAAHGGIVHGMPRATAQPKLFPVSRLTGERVNAGWLADYA